MGLGREVYLKQDPSTEKTASGIYLPASMQDTEKENIGTIVMVGPGTDQEPMLYKKGERVKFAPHAGRELTIDNEDLRLVVDTDIYCILKNTLVGVSPDSVS